MANKDMIDSFKYFSHEPAPIDLLFDPLFFKPDIFKRARRVSKFSEITDCDVEPERPSRFTEEKFQDHLANEAEQLGIRDRGKKLCVYILSVPLRKVAQSHGAMNWSGRLRQQARTPYARQRDVHEDLRHKCKKELVDEVIRLRRRLSEPDFQQMYLCTPANQALAVNWETERQAIMEWRRDKDREEARERARTIVNTTKRGRE